MGIRGFGPTREIAFEQAAIALTAVIADIDKIEPEQKIEITCKAADVELLLVEWLSCLVYEMATRKMLFRRFEVNIEQEHLRAIAWGQRMDVKIHQPAVEVKAVTYTALSVRQDKNGIWIAQCIVDV